MSVINPISSNIFNAELLNSPAAALAAWISIFGAVITLLTIVARALFKYRRSHDLILKKSGIPAFVLNFFFIRISLKKLPTITWVEKTVTILFSLLFCILFIFLDQRSSKPLRLRQIVRYFTGKVQASHFTYQIKSRLRLQFSPFLTGKFQRMIARNHSLLIQRNTSH